MARKKTNAKELMPWERFWNRVAGLYKKKQPEILGPFLKENGLRAFKHYNKLSIGIFKDDVCIGEIPGSFLANVTESGRIDYQKVIDLIKTWAPLDKKN
jgi:hypothetical protein